MTVLLLLFLCFSFPFSSSSSSSNLVSREFFPMEGTVAWVVQVSDLHISAYHRDRADDLVRLLSPALRIIRPHLLLVTGDITDAKNRKKTSTRQHESEWIQYSNAMDTVVKQSGIDKRRVFDIRGNHDKYGVPCVGSNLDFFSSHSVSSQLSRLSNIQSISLVGNDMKYMFLGIDDTMNIGIRGPSNLFGHPTDDQIDALESELRYWDKIQPNSSITKVVFGHFPMSFTASSEKGKRYETIFARQSVSAYICGHLHAKFSKQLWKRHNIEVTSGDSKMSSRVKKQFWEWELGDWKEFKLIRIVAVDEGEVSFVDVDLSGKQDNFQTTILITYPTDSRNMNRVAAVPENKLVRNDINALIFSARPILNITAKVFDSSRGFKIVEELPMLRAASDSALGSESFYHAKWNAENYRSDPSAARYWLQVCVVDSQGNQTVSELRPFSVEGKPATAYPSTWLAFLVFGFRWEALYSILLWSNVFFLFLLLFLPKLLNQFMGRSSSYQKWAASVSISSTVQQRRVFFTALWFLIEGSRSRALWSSMTIYLLYLLRFPWFWGHVTSVNGDVAPMYLFGWRVNSSTSVNATDDQWLGNPDVMTITLPFMYFVVTPLLLLVYFLFAERSAACFQSSTRKLTKMEQKSQLVAGSLSKSSETSNIFSLLRPKTRQRAYLLFACLVLICVHFKQRCALMAAYGVTTVALSSAFSWIPPLLLVSAVYSTRHA